MNSLDWSVVAVLCIGIMGFAFWSRRYTRSVADFLAANRCGGRYLLAIAEGMALIGAISFVADFERCFSAGFATSFWVMLYQPILAIMALSGWIIYRFRQTRSLTFAQFFEVRYNKAFRIFAGTVLFLAGVVNFGIFPGIGSKLFINFLNLPPTFELLGIQFSTFVVTMILLLTISVVITIWGGQISIMMTDFLQGSVFLAAMVLIAIIYFFRYDMDTTIYETLVQRPPGKSMINPFDTGKQSFNLWFYAISLFIFFYNYRNWQNGQGYNTAARNPHEARMAGILGSCRWYGYSVVSVLVPLAAFVVMNNPEFSDLANSIRETISGIQGEKQQVQMITPVFLSKTLPTGVMGLFLAVLFFAFVSTHDTFLHSWASTFIQDVYLPVSGKKLSNKEHLKYLRIAIVGVAVFAFLWSYFLSFDEHINMYWMITSAIFLGGSGSVVIGGLYWKRGTTAAAFTAMIVGGGLSVAGLVVRYINPDFCLSSQMITLISMVSAIISYIGVSLIWPKPDFNLDKMLHRGRYAIKDDLANDKSDKVAGWMRHFHITKEFTKLDKFLYFFVLGLNVFWCLVACVILVLHFVLPKYGLEFSNRNWFALWKYKLIFSLILSVIIVFWFLIGGCKDIKDMVRILSRNQRNELDDGRVEDGHNLADEEITDTKVAISEKRLVDN